MVVEESMSDNECVVGKMISYERGGEAMSTGEGEESRGEPLICIFSRDKRPPRGVRVSNSAAIRFCFHFAPSSSTNYIVNLFLSLFSLIFL